MLDTRVDSMTLEQKILTMLGNSQTKNIKLESTKFCNRNLYVDEPRLDMIQWVTRAFTTSVRKSLDTALLLWLATHYTEEQLKRLPVSAISHLVDVRFIRDANGGIGYEIKPKLKTMKI